MDDPAAADTVAQMTEWRDSAAKRLAARVTLPIFYLLNRPSLLWLVKAIYDFALRCNGICINYKGRQGLTVGEEHFLKRHLKGVRSGVFFDVGANRGAYAAYLHMLVPAARIYAFEPHPRSFALLAESAGSDTIVPVNKALSDAPSHMTLYDFADHDGSTQASLSPDAVKLFSSRVVKHAVECTTLDIFMRENGIEKIDFLKVDTEGFDLSVLQGASNALAENRIGVIQFEFIPANIITKVRVRDFMELLRRYRIYRLCLNGSLIPLEPYDVKRCEIYAMQNLIAMAR
jgi:FkbM family methyltransferase